MLFVMTSVLSVVCTAILWQLRVAPADVIQEVRLIRTEVDGVKTKLEQRGEWMNWVETVVGQEFTEPNQPADIRSCDACEDKE